MKYIRRWIRQWLCKAFIAEMKDDIEELCSHLRSLNTSAGGMISHYSAVRHHIHNIEKTFEVDVVARVPARELLRRGAVMLAFVNRVDGGELPVAQIKEWLFEVGMLLNVEHPSNNFLPATDREE